MTSSEACERRVYRLATLLTGNPVAATRVITSVVHAQPDLKQLDSAHLDRLTVLRSREIKPVRLKDPRLGPKYAAALAALGEQQREAWVFRHVYRMEPRDVARAMDCSVRAVDHHLQKAEVSMTAAIGDQAAAGDAILRFSMQLDVPDFFRAKAARRRRWRRVIRLALWLGAIGLLVVAILLVVQSRALDGLGF